MARERRRSIKNTPYRLRAQGQCSKQYLKQRQRLEMGATCLLISVQLVALPNIIRRALLLSAVINFATYNYFRSVLYYSSRWHWHPTPTFDRLEANWCWHHLRFKKKHLWRISEALLLPAEHRLDNGSWTDNQEMLIIFFLRLGSTDKWLSLEDKCGVEYSRMSRIFKVSVSLILLQSFLLLKYYF